MEGKGHMEIIRRDELQELLDIVEANPHEKFLITGAAGSGKTFLLNIIGKILEEQGKDISYDNIALALMNSKIGKPVYESEDVIYLVDDLDERYRYRQTVEFIKNIGGCYVCAANGNYIIFLKRGSQISTNDKK